MTFRGLRYLSLVNLLDASAAPPCYGVHFLLAALRQSARGSFFYRSISMRLGKGWKTYHGGAALAGYDSNATGNLDAIPFFAAAAVSLVPPYDPEKEKAPSALPKRLVVP